MRFVRDHDTATAVALFLDRLRMDDRTPGMLAVTDKAIAELQAFRDRLAKSDLPK